jgi:hypothetical protein
VASADSSSDWLSSIDSLLGGSALPAPSSGLDLAISFDGYSLVQDGTASAETTTGDYSLAIAEGDDADATAYGTGNTAIADGDGAASFANAGTGDYALADGINAEAGAGGVSGDTGGNYDTAIDIGNNDATPIGAADGAFAGNADLEEPAGIGTGSYDTAIDIGNNTNDGGFNGSDGAFAGAGGLIGEHGDGNNDTAIDIGNNSGLQNGSDAAEGNGNYASETGSTTGYDEDTIAGFGGDNNTAVDDASYTANESYVIAGNGNDNYASVLGPENSTASASGDSNIAYVLDPFGSTASDATSGDGITNSDLAAVLLTDGTATANTVNDMYDILTAFGPETGTF